MESLTAITTSPVTSESVEITMRPTRSAGTVMEAISLLWERHPITDPLFTPQEESIPRMEEGAEIFPPMIYADGWFAIIKTANSPPSPAVSGCTTESPGPPMVKSGAGTTREIGGAVPPFTMYAPDLSTAILPAWSGIPTLKDLDLPSSFPEKCWMICTTNLPCNYTEPP